MKQKVSIFNVLNITFMVLLCLTMIYPIWNSLVKSFSSNTEILMGHVHFWPKGFNLEGYKVLFNDSLFFTSLMNTIFIVVVGTILRLCVSLLAGFSFSKRYLLGYKPLFLYFLLTMFFNGGLIPTFITIRNLGLYNRLWVLILLGSAPVYDIILARSFFEQIPIAIEESAFIDGAGYATVFFKLILPISKPIVATLTIFSTVTLWNLYMPGIIYIQDSVKYPLQVFVRLKVFLEEMLAQNPNTVVSIAEKDYGVFGLESMKMAILATSSIPIIMVYPFFQRYFIKGVTLGAVKS